jgi:hypothetical protein
MLLEAVSSGSAAGCNRVRPPRGRREATRREGRHQLLTSAGFGERIWPGFRAAKIGPTISATTTTSSSISAATTKSTPTPTSSATLTLVPNGLPAGAKAIAGLDVNANVLILTFVIMTGENVGVEHGGLVLLERYQWLNQIRCSYRGVCIAMTNSIQFAGIRGGRQNPSCPCRRKRPHERRLQSIFARRL